ncbi:MAG: glutamate--cysteine ligase, partial [Pseudomonadota bacterium]
LRSLDAAWDLVKHWSMDEREALRNEVPKEGLDAQIPGGHKLLDMAGEVLDIASAGLTARGRLNTSGDNETGFLDPLRDVVAKGKTPAQQLLDLYHGEWAGDLSQIYPEMSF